MPRLSRSSLRFSLALLTLLALIAGTPFGSIPRDFSLLYFLIAAGLVAFCSNFPVVLPRTEINLAHAVGLGLLFTFGPVSALWATVAGLIVGEGVRAWRWADGAAPLDVARVFANRLASALVRQVLPLLAPAAVYVWLGGRFPIDTLAGNKALPWSALALTYIALYTLFVLLGLDPASGAVRELFRANIVPLGALELLPLPLAVFAAAGYHLLGLNLLLALGGITAVTTFTLHGFSRAQIELARRIVENDRLHAETERRAAELTRLLDISSNLNTTLGTQDVLKMICASARQMAQAAGAAVYLLDTARAELTLAQTEGLNHGFEEGCPAISITQDEAGAALVTGEPRLALDLAADAPAGWSKILETQNLRAYLALPLRAQGEPVGSVIVFFREPPQFQPWTIEVLRAFGHQAALTIANTHLYTRTEQVLARRVRQLAALESLSRELSASLDLQRVFDTIVARARDETNATVGQLGIVDATGAQLVFVAWRGLPSDATGGAIAVVEADQRRSWPLEHGGVAGRVLRTGQAARIGDVRLDPDYITINRDLRSELCVPIEREARRLGVIVLESERNDAFSEEDEAFVGQLAVQAAIAIDNARLYHEAQLRLREQSILYEASATLASSLDIRATYAAVAQQLTNAVNADACVLSDFDAETGTVRKVEPRNLTLTYAAADFPATAQTLRERTPLIIRVDDPRAPRLEAAALKAEGYGAALRLPMVASDQSVGLVELYARQPRDFSEAEIRLAQTLANQAAIAIQNARLFRRVTEARDRLAAVLNSTHEGVLVVDATGLVSLINPRLEEFWGLSADQILGRHMLALLDAPEVDIAARLGFQREEVEELLMTLRAGLALSIPKVQFQLSGPRSRFLERSGAPVLDQLAKAIGWVIILRDVTEEKEIEEVRGALSSMIVHDLRSPLTTVLVSLGMIRSHLPPAAASPVIDQALEVSSRSLNKVLGLVNTILDISRMESGELTLNRSPVNLDQLVEEVVADLTPLANEYGVFLIHETPASLPTAWADREKISRILTNLIDNALKFTPAGGQVWVRSGMAATDAWADGSAGLQCAVLDAGPGIPDDYRDKIFDRFAQIRGRQGRRAGSGLGLAFCKMAVEAHGGKIWVENRPEGGSKFSFTLPSGTGE